MKIISKFKDYYDYLQGIYGVDEKIVYERKLNHKDSLNYHVPSILGEHQFSILAICGTLYCVHRYKGNFYFGDWQLIDEKIYERSYHHSNMSIDLFEKYSQEKPSSFNDYYHLKKTDLNIKYNEPILLYGGGFSYRNDDNYCKNVRLTDFGINKIISAHDIYIMISNFLSKEVEVKRTDKEKIVSRGFDLKTSFRH